MSKQAMKLGSAARELLSGRGSRYLATSPYYSGLGAAWKTVEDSKGITHATFHRTHHAETLRAQLSKVSEGKDGLIRAALLMDTTPVTDKDVEIIKAYCQKELGIQIFADPTMVGKSYPSREDGSPGYWSGPPEKQLEHIKRITDEEGYRVLLPAYGSGGPHIPGLEKFSPKEATYGIGTPFSHHAYYSALPLFAGQIVTTQIGHIAKAEGVTPMIVDALKSALDSTGMSLHSITPANELAAREGEIIGRLMGGNAGVALESSKLFSSRFAGNIAYFEQYGPMHVHEMHRQIIGNVDRALTGGATAIILSDLKFKGQEAELKDAITRVKEMCTERGTPIHLAQGLGHGARLLPVQLGAQVALRTEGGVARLDCDYSAMFRPREKQSWVERSANAGSSPGLAIGC
jgi:LD-carboxypeptidase